MGKGFCGERKLASTQKSRTTEHAKKKMVSSKNNMFGSYEDLLKDCLLCCLHHDVGWHGYVQSFKAGCRDEK